MKILYSIQATGNGHISRAMEILPHLKRYGQVDLFLSGANSTLPLDAPVRFRSKGLSLFYTCKGSLNYWKMASALSPKRVLDEARDLPVEKYDLIVNDFESITALACRIKNVPSIQFGHQASFQSARTPRPVIRSGTGEWILRNYATATQYLGLHFDRYDDFIHGPVIKKEITEAEPKSESYTTIYLPSYCFPTLKRVFGSLHGHRFEIFSDEFSTPTVDGNIHWMPVCKQLFNQSLVNCSGIITGGGFETPAEAMFLRKKLMSIPIRGQYEQKCNAAALSKLGVTVLDKIDSEFPTRFECWMAEQQVVSLPAYQSTGNIVEILMERAAAPQPSNLVEA